MKNHLRGTAILFGFSLVLVCVAYPAAIWLYAHILFPDSAAGSLIATESGGKETVQGSRLIAQPFTKDWYFKPRPSAASYNATASGATNFGASNPLLRDSVARRVALVVKYDPDGHNRGGSVQKDIEEWFTGYVPNRDKKEPALIVQWSVLYPALAVNWLKDSDKRLAVAEWLRGHPEILDDWKKSHPEADLPDLDDEKSALPYDDIASSFFKSVAATRDFQNRWLEAKEFDTGKKNDNGKPKMGKRFKPVSEGDDLRSTFFEMWLQAHPGVVFQQVPADMVTTSGSGLDPHITLRSARYQLDGVVEARAKALMRAAADLKPRVEAILTEQAFVPLSGLIGEPLVNVLELNIELDKHLPLPASPTSP